MWGIREEKLKKMRGNERKESDRRDWRHHPFPEITFCSLQGRF